MSIIIAEKNILHIIYSDKKDDLYYSIESLADEYEGKIPNRIGVNFPLQPHHPMHKKYISKYNVSYLVMYKKGDAQTKHHELQHARYHLDQTFRTQVKTLWNSFDKKSKDNVLMMLKKMGYPSNMDILLDEFQAYYFTEKPNFFGKLKFGKLK